MKYHNRWYTVLDPDLQMGGGGEGSGGHPDPEKTGGEVSKTFFRRTSLGSARRFPSYRSYSENSSRM